MLHAARMNPKISAYELLEGHFDYNIPPLASHGRKVIIHKKLQQKKSWARMEIRPGTLDQHFNITGATGCISQRHAMIVYPIQWNLPRFPQTTFESSANRSTKTSK